MATNRGGSDASDAWLIGSFQRWQLIFPGRRHPRRSGAPKWSDDGMVQQPVGQRAPQSSPPLQSAARNKVEISSHGQGIETSPGLFRVQKKVRWIERGPSSCLVTKRPIKHTEPPSPLAWHVRTGKAAAVASRRRWRRSGHANQAKSGMHRLVSSGRHALARAGGKTFCAC
ncbi:hypothetical protein SEVIR_5G255900v4 [Setaria viridis]|uniref:Uncharacterized protein n=1 Tax=Setaria viridis TaxID=4556 RepID=A0A4U6UKU2_SETVI|nr:hypothetical protein SEVIR_5G255900v2 [Setaria viridis]